MQKIFLLAPDNRGDFKYCKCSGIDFDSERKQDEENMNQRDNDLLRFLESGGVFAWMAHSMLPSVFLRQPPHHRLKFYKGLLILTLIVVPLGCVSMYYHVRFSGVATVLALNIAYRYWIARWRRYLIKFI